MEANNTALDWGIVNPTLQDVWMQTRISSNSSKDMTLNASKASDVYGNSTTVQPKTIISQYLIKY